VADVAGAPGSGAGLEPGAETAPDSGAPPPTGSSDGRSPGWRDVLLIAVAIVVVILGLAVLTSLLPVGLQDVVFRSPLAIVVLIVGTVGLLLWVTRRPTPRV
jgi:hypothetical protein